MTSNPQLVLNTRKARNFSGFHPWVLSHSIVEPTSPLMPETVADLVTTNGNWLARGVYNPNSRIRLRLYQWQAEQDLDQAWINQKIDHALELRNRSGDELDAVRLINSEGDGLSGLIIDQFGKHLVVQLTAGAMKIWIDGIVTHLCSRLAPESVRIRIDESTAKLEGIDARDEVVYGAVPDEPITVQENGVKLSIDLTGGQKTGYYLDQRANRLSASKWIQAGSLLDVCCYQGGFSLAAKAQAGEAIEQIVGIDSSLRAIEQAKANFALNGFEGVEFIKGDCFAELEKLVASGKQFDNVVLDPPRMANHHKQVDSALRAYHRLNLSAVQLLKPGGWLVSCSCTGRISRDDLIGVLGSVSQRAGRSIQLVEQRGADFDHPIAANCPESNYLKCLICRVL